MDIALITGRMMTGDEKRARGLGMMIHLVVMGTVVFGLLYGALFFWLPGRSGVHGRRVRQGHADGPARRTRAVRLGDGLGVRRAGVSSEEEAGLQRRR